MLDHMNNTFHSTAFQISVDAPLTALIKVQKETMHKVCVGTDRPHAQTKFLKKAIKQKRFRNNFEIKNRDEIKLKLIFK